MRQPVVPTSDGDYISYEDGELDAADLAASVALPTPANSLVTSVIFQNTTADPIRWRADGSAPTASAGFVLAEGDMIQWTGELSKLRFIKESGSPALWYQFVKRRDFSPQ